tara:strand:- start:376 stop:1437 length:1062 start_codon:yes stop_codon:yes gene_type:complete
MNDAEIEISGTKLGPSHSPYIIAEISANHNGNIENAYKLITEAKNAGASAVKIQTYTADTITMKCSKPEFQILDGLWKGQTLYDLYQSAHMPWDWQTHLFQFAKEIGITLFSSPFDFTAVDFLEGLDAPAYKIASFEAVDLPLIKYAASTGKPLIISTGIANKREIGEAIDAASGAGCSEIAILHCVSGYPAAPSDYNLATIPDMRDSFNIIVGLSDHTISNTTAISSVSLGAAIIEKHFTLDRQGGGPDDSFSLEPTDLQELCRETKIAHEALGRVNYDLKEGEKENSKFRRSLYFTADFKRGHVIRRGDVRSIRPGYGLPPKFLDQIMGSQINDDVSAGTACSWDLISKAD